MPVQTQVDTRLPRLERQDRMSKDDEPLTHIEILEALALQIDQLNPETRRSDFDGKEDIERAFANEMGGPTIQIKVNKYAFIRLASVISHWEKFKAGTS